MSQKVEVERTQTSFRLPTELLKEMKVRCAVEGSKLNDYVGGLIARDMRAWRKKNRVLLPSK